MDTDRRSDQLEQPVRPAVRVNEIWFALHFP